MVAVVIPSAAFESEMSINGVAVCMALTIIPIEYGFWNPLLFLVGESLHLANVGSNHSIGPM